jgi:hypothetical protein
MVSVKFPRPDEGVAVLVDLDSASVAELVSWPVRTGTAGRQRGLSSPAL